MFLNVLISYLVSNAKLTADPPWWKKLAIVRSNILPNPVLTSLVGHSSKNGLEKIKRITINQISSDTKT